MSTVGGTADDPRAGDGDGKVEQQGRLRDQAGRQRDTAATRRDDHAARRDEAADERDGVARRRNASHVPTDIDSNSDPHWAGLRSAAEADRGHAHVDRVGAANDRADAAIDRQEALADRMAAARDRRQAGLDGLTGTYNREAGLVELNRDLARASRAGQLLIIAFVDVDQLKTLNDSHGHAAGDRALIAVAETLLAVLRPYDLVVRYGGDEFLCAAEGIDVHAARSRFARVNQLLTKAVPGLTVTAGVAKLRLGESTESVVARADADLYQQRKQRPPPRPRSGSTS